MTHSLYGERFFGRREPAWHNLGLVVPETWEGSPADAIRLARCDYPVQKIPVTVDLPNGQCVPTDRVALVRMPHNSDSDYAVLGFAGPRYEPMQNIEIGQMLSKLAAQWPVETVGALGKGETLFVTLRVGQFSPTGKDNERVESFLLVQNSHDGKGGLRVMLVRVRVVCQNTLIMATESAMIKTSIPHLSTVRDDAEFHLKLIGSVVQRNQAVDEEFVALAQRRITPEEAYTIFSAAYPDPKPTKKAILANTVIADQSIADMVQSDETLSERLELDLLHNRDNYAREVARVEALREEAANLYLQTSQKSPDIALTAYAAWQGVTELESYRGNTKPDTSVSIVFGDRGANMARAYAKALTLI